MTNYTEVKVSELEGIALDYAVAKAIGLVATGERIINGPILVSDTQDGLQRKFAPSTDWAHGGPLLDDHNIALNGGIFESTRVIYATYRDVAKDLPCPSSVGATRLVAACRSIVKANLGETVTIPTELLERTGANLLRCCS